jgi:hypothetical protein
VAAAQDALEEALEELRFWCTPLDTPHAERPWKRELPLEAVSIHVPLSGVCRIAVDTPVWTHWLHRGEILVVNQGIGGSLLAMDEAEPLEMVSALVEFDAPHGHPLLDGLPDLIQAGPGGGVVPASFAPLLDAFLTEMEKPRPASSFCRAFRRELGVSPAAYWREIHCRPFPRRPEGPGKTRPAAEAAHARRDGCELRVTAEDGRRESAERGHPPEPE